MSDDREAMTTEQGLVERLRLATYRRSITNIALIGEAADEIERLRKIVDHVRKNHADPETGALYNCETCRLLKELDRVTT